MFLSLTDRKPTESRQPRASLLRCVLGTEVIHVLKSSGCGTSFLLTSGRPSKTDDFLLVIDTGLGDRIGASCEIIDAVGSGDCGDSVIGNSEFEDNANEDAMPFLELLTLHPCDADECFLGNDSFIVDDTPTFVDELSKTCLKKSGGDTLFGLRGSKLWCLGTSFEVDSFLFGIGSHAFLWGRSGHILVSDVRWTLVGI